MRTVIFLLGILVVGLLEAHWFGIGKTPEQKIKYKQARDEACNSIVKILKTGDEAKTKGRFKMESLKKYLDSHQDSLITLAIIIIVDHFIFDGAFRAKIKSSVEKLLDQNVKNLTKKSK